MVASCPSELLVEDALISRPIVAPTIKLLDLLTNRYHLGLVRKSSAGVLEVELPMYTYFQAGQRVRFFVAVDQRLVAREEMRSALVTYVKRDVQRQCVRVDLSLPPATAAA